ncbi:eukaryotic translation initiation factor 2 subunit 2-like [Crassostrea angulata]|uniref:Eukaryotic translation initiation factor 2 subunit 2 n=1 Tax=Magallana gigas TaxID=29159 RepID=A0A8W8JVZ9_MAGGI|nr:eukaryotic translation initiation factor 2 subunit 2 [Crassostrea gigas]XP_052718312.1 eukaryotic translation initiation factor 2 subunit 2-like [Crassostrea angulata]
MFTVPTRPPYFKSDATRHCGSNMAEDELLPFDPSNMKKKKKKKKMPFELDGGTEEAETPTPAPEEEAPAAEPETSEKADDDFSLDFGIKKKKKKKKAFDMNELEDNLPEPESKAETEEQEAPEGVEEDMNFALPLKKKKKKKVDFTMIENEDSEKPSDDLDLDDARPVPEGKAWLASDRDYTYDELLTRVFDIIREKNPDMVAGEKKKFVMRPPQVLKVGTRKSSFANFSDICRLLHRQPKHVLAFLLAELGTSGSVDGNNQLIIKGKYNQKQIENVLRRYIKEYVTCHTCRSPDTLLQKDTRIFFLQCESCGSRCSVTSIKSGFQAVTGKRAAIRAKTA